MGRKPRVLTRPNALVEVVNRTFQGRFLIKPGQEMNPLIVGAMAKAQQSSGVQIHTGAFLGGHFHLIISTPTVKALADFMRDFTRKLSIESGRLHSWEGRVFPDRYRATEISEEAEAQISRLTYCLSHGAKENLVASPLDWPGIPFAEAMISGEPLQGAWIDRTAYQEARSRGEKVTLSDFTEHLDLFLAPLPCLAHLNRHQRRSFILGLVRKIETETADRHQIDGTSPIGAEAVLSAKPRSGPTSFEPSPKPLFHTFTREAFIRMREALRLILTAYREAAERLRKGESTATFPENTFPSAGNFVEPIGMGSALLLKPQPG